MASEADALLAAHGYAGAARIGGGAFGSVRLIATLRVSYDTRQVYKHEPVSGGEPLAIKVALSAHERELACREAEVMTALPPHPNIVPLHSFACFPDGALLAMPFATGGDVLRFMQDRNCAPLPADDAKLIFSQLVAAVKHMHEAGFVHRDIKCENVLLTGPRRRSVLLADYGFACRYQIGTKSLREPWGSLHYSSPEICAQVPYEGPEVDVWSMGVVLFALLTGRLPFGGQSEAETAERIMAGSYAVPATVPNDQADLIRGMLNVDASRRLTVVEVATHPWLAAPPPPPPPAAADAAPPIAHRHPSQAAMQVVRPLRLSEEPEAARRNSSPTIQLPARLAQAGKRVMHFFRANKG